jgi:hypothetical protein
MKSFMLLTETKKPIEISNLQIDSTAAESI